MSSVLDLTTNVKCDVCGQSAFVIVGQGFLCAGCALGAIAGTPYEDAPPVIICDRCHRPARLETERGFLCQDCAALEREDVSPHPTHLPVTLDDLLAARQEIRTEVALGIHDDTLQAITAIGLHLGRLRMGARDLDTTAALQELERILGAVTSRLRFLMFELVPPSLEQQGLESALRQALGKLEGQFGLVCRLRVSLRKEPEASARTTLYQIAHEALTNIRKHSQAGFIELTVEEAEHGYLLKISDDGVGFGPDELTITSGHLGIASMHERAERAGGWIHVGPGSSAGTEVECWIPE